MCERNKYLPYGVEWCSGKIVKLYRRGIFHSINDAQ